MIKGFILTVQCFTVRYTFACSVDIRLYKIERERERGLLDSLDVS